MSVDFEDNLASHRIQNRKYEKEWFLRAEELIKRNVDLDRGDAVFIDFGCSACELLENIESRYKIKGIAADFSQKAVEYAMSIGFDAFCFDGNKLDSLPEKYYGVADFATSTANIEHILNLDEMFQIIYTALKDNGVFVFTTPNSSAIENCVNQIYFGEPLNEGHHYRFLTRAKLYFFLIINGFDIVDEENLVRSNKFWRVSNFVLNLLLKLSRPIVGRLFPNKMFKKGFNYPMDFNVIEWGFSAKKDKNFFPLGSNLELTTDISDEQKKYMLDKIRRQLFEKGFISKSFFENVTAVLKKV